MSVECMAMAGVLAVLVTAKLGLLLAETRLANPCAKTRAMVRERTIELDCVS